MKQVQEKTGVDLLAEILIGVFDNRAQVEAELEAGGPIHPFAKHVTGDITDRVHNIPDSHTGRFILEESYYTHPGEEMKIKPLLFYLEPDQDKNVKLHSMVIPSRYEPEEVTNDNASLFFDFLELNESPRFKAAIYQYQEDGSFTVRNPNDWGDGMTFTLIERLAPDRLEVMELLEKNGKRVTPYDSPIIYDRKKS